MRRGPIFRLVFGAVLAGALALGTARVHAITYGVIDTGNLYPNVGAFMVERPDGSRISPLCTGTLVTPNVFLTASHCTIYFEQVLAPRGYRAYVSFDQSIPWGAPAPPSLNLIPVAVSVTNPNYSQRQDDSGDVGALILAENVIGLTPATLPSCGLLDDLSAKNGLKDSVFIAVGYGVQERVVGGGEPSFMDANPVPRAFAFSSFDALSPGYVRLSQNPTLGDGGTCYGDSGGPNFLPLNNQLLLAAVTTTGDTACRATNVDYRLDTAGAQSFFEYVNSQFGTAIPTSTCPQ